MRCAIIDGKMVCDGIEMTMSECCSMLNEMDEEIEQLKNQVRYYQLTMK